MTNNELFDYFKTLSVDQLLDLETLVSEQLATTNFDNELIKYINDIHTCPKCGGSNIKKNGHNKKTKHQMFFCKDCHKQFTATHNSLVHSTKKPISTWFIAVESVLNRDKLEVMAQKCNIHKTTAFYWRHKILDRINDIVNKTPLKDEIYLDETLEPVTFEDIKSNCP